MKQIAIMAKKKSQKVNKWSAGIKTVSTFPPEGLFTKDAATIAKLMASKKVSPKGIGSGIRMVQMFINRAGKKLDPRQRKELEKAKRLLQDKNKQRKAAEK
jgi:tRNA(adenine34) deaminase